MAKPNFHGKSDDDSIYIENMMSSRSVYKSEITKDRYTMEPSGYAGSIVAIPVKIAKESYLQRAIDRGKLSVLSDAEALKKMDTLELRDEGFDGMASFEAALAEGASDSGSRYTKQNLSESGSEKGSYSVSDIVDDIKTGGPKKTAVKPKQAKSVKRASAAKQAAEEPAEITIEVTESLSEGEWPAVPEVEGI